MRLDNVPRELRQRRDRPIALVDRRVRVAFGQFAENLLDVEGLLRASLRQDSLPVATIVDAEPLQSAARAGFAVTSVKMGDRVSSGWRAVIVRFLSSGWRGRTNAGLNREKIFSPALDVNGRQTHNSDNEVYISILAAGAFPTSLESPRDFALS